MHLCTSQVRVNRNPYTPVPLWAAIRCKHKCAHTRVKSKSLRSCTEENVETHRFVHIGWCKHKSTYTGTSALSRGCTHVERGTPQGCAHTRSCMPLGPTLRPSPEKVEAPIRPKLGHSCRVWAPSSPREQRKDQQTGRPLRRGLCCPCFRASITRSPRAPEHEMAVGGGAGRGDPEQRPLTTPGKARRPAPLRRRTARRAFPRSLRRAPGHKGLEGKHGARPASTERLAVRSGLERTTGAGAGLAGTARWGAGWGVGRRSFPSPRPPSTAVTASRAGVGRRGPAGRRRRTPGRRGEGLAPPFSVARPNGGSGCFYPGAEGTTRLWESQRPSLQILCSVRALQRGS